MQTLINDHHATFTIFPRTNTGDLPELFVEVRQVVEPAFVTHPGNTDVLIEKQPAGMSDPKLVDKLGKRLGCQSLKVPAKSGCCHVDAARCLV